MDILQRVNNSLCLSVNIGNLRDQGIIVVSPCYVLLAEGKQGDKGAGQLLIMVSYDLLKELQMRPFFMSMRGVISNYQPCHNVTNNLF